jgi:GAF domain-containing protein
MSDRRRLALLEQHGLLTDTPEEAFDRYTRLAAAILDAPVALFTVIVGPEQRFRSQFGLEEPLATERRTPLSHSFCQYVVLSGAPLVVEDAREDPTTRGNPAIEDLGILAYLGMPLMTRKGECLGSLCGIDHEPRSWSAADRAALKDLAATTVNELELRRTTRDAVEFAAQLEAKLRGLKPSHTGRAG